MAQQNGGLKAARKFSRLYLIPNMGHCGGGPATDQFDLLSPLVAWVEQGADPDPIAASGTNFTSPPTAGHYVPIRKKRAISARHRRVAISATRPTIDV
jgi:hypothetical protein